MGPEDRHSQPHSRACAQPRPRPGRAPEALSFRQLSVQGRTPLREQDRPPRTLGNEWYGQTESRSPADDSGQAGQQRSSSEGTESLLLSLFAYK